MAEIQAWLKWVTDLQVKRPGFKPRCGDWFVFFNLRLDFPHRASLDRAEKILSCWQIVGLHKTKMLWSNLRWPNPIWCNLCLNCTQYLMKQSSQIKIYFVSDTFSKKILLRWIILYTNHFLDHLYKLCSVSCCVLSLTMSNEHSLNVKLQIKILPGNKNSITISSLFKYVTLKDALLISCRQNNFPSLWKKGSKDFKNYKIERKNVVDCETSYTEICNLYRHCTVNATLFLRITLNISEILFISMTEWQVFISFKYQYWHKYYMKVLSHQINFKFVPTNVQIILHVFTFCNNNNFTGRNYCFSACGSIIGQIGVSSLSQLFSGASCYQRNKYCK